MTTDAAVPREEPTREEGVALPLPRRTAERAALTIREVITGLAQREHQAECNTVGDLEHFDSNGTPISATGHILTELGVAASEINDTEPVARQLSNLDIDTLAVINVVESVEYEGRSAHELDLAAYAATQALEFVREWEGRA
ncbi:hypothetical protein GCM10012275_56540 [Longimycelium tulufanense]|uniref:Uncharacterized protein n=1 Tax=Longimycelium tulufanense TaxID=907463 RepID=A0A8J3FWM4_9PSEU|nr:hypothetical protein [Longimycelium tulufanense]GGM78594.1 hypothetical protein GCM10012275_56540 [Longimycelium tulufanense]